MFAGIVQAVGCVRRQSERGGDRELGIDWGALAPPALAPGASVAVNGVCLTVTRLDERGFDADVSAETLAVTTLGRLAVGDPVNLEPSLRLGDPVDGHLVYGHVDAVGRVRSVRAAARSLRVEIEVPATIARYVAPKGSIAVDGVSLTVNEITGLAFVVNIIPHTRDATIISGYRAGTPVNIEVDMMARYLERLAQAEASTISTETLEQHGFATDD